MDYEAEVGKDDSSSSTSDLVLMFKDGFQSLKEELDKARQAQDDRFKQCMFSR